MSLAVILNRFCSSPGISFLHLRILTPVEHNASNTRIDFPSLISHSFSRTSASSITDLVLAGAIAGLRNPEPVFLAGPLGMCEGLSCPFCMWMRVLPSNHIEPGQP